MVDETKEKSQQERLDELSQKLFDKPAKEIKYLLVTGYIHQQLLEEELGRAGLYQWINVFNGKVKYPRDVIDYNDYDIVQVNMSTQDIHLVNDIKESLKKDSKTKVVVNNDYTTEMWGNAFGNPNTLAREVKEADMIFGTEYFQVTALAELTNRKVYVIPHPADIKRLKSLAPLPIKNIISTIWRRYDKHSYIPSLVVKNHGLTTQLIGFDKKQEPKTWLITSLYDHVFAGTNCFDFQNQMRESKIVYDPFTFHSYNRAIVECAALGVLVVGSNRTQSVNVCYPFTKVDPYDVITARKLIEKLLTDKEFCKKVIDFAKEKSEYYNHENSMEKYLIALEESVREGKVSVNNKIEKETLEKGSGEDVNIIIAKDITRKK